jgi:hypothetical protein
MTVELEYIGVHHEMENSNKVGGRLLPIGLEHGDNGTDILNTTRVSNE